MKGKSRQRTLINFLGNRKIYTFTLYSLIAGMKSSALYTQCQNFTSNKTKKWGMNLPVSWCKFMSWVLWIKFKMHLRKLFTKLHGFNCVNVSAWTIYNNEISLPLESNDTTSNYFWKNICMPYFLSVLFLKWNTFSVYLMTAFQLKLFRSMLRN